MSDVLLLQAQDDIERGHFDRALVKFSQVLQEQPNNALAYEGSAVALYNLKREEEAAKMSLEAIQRDSNLVVPHTVLAYVLYNQGDHSRGMQEAMMALELNRTSADALTCAGILNLFGGHLDDARRYLAAAIKIDPTNYLAQHNLAVIYQNTGDHKLVSQLVALFRLKPSLRNAAKVLYISGRQDRLAYLLLLFLSALVGVLSRPELILIVAGAVLVLYMGTGFFMAFGMGKRQVNELLTNMRMSIGYSGLALLLYFLARLAQALLSVLNEPHP